MSKIKNACKNKFRSYMVKEPLELLKKTKLDYALTTYQAETIVQRYLFPSRIDIYIREEDLSYVVVPL